jgi:hypothetical protein
MTEQKADVTLTEIKALWKKHGGKFHGPNVEHAYCEEQAFYRFCKELAAWNARPADDVVEAWSIIDQLRANEGDSIEICYDNPDFGGPNCVIVVRNSWDVDGQNFYGDTVLDCLRAALAKAGAL